MVRGVIYDMDDLMVNSSPLHMQAFETALASYGHSLAELPVAVRTGFIGRRIIDIATDVAAILNLPISVNELCQKRMAVFLKLVNEKLEPMPGLRESLALFKQHHLNIALASSGTTEYIGIVLDRFNIRSYFDVIISGDDVKKGKPDPEVFLKAAASLKLCPADCVVLEDATHGIAAAKAAGCFCIAVPGNTLPQDQSKADLIVQSLGHITLPMLHDLARNH